MKNKSLAKLVLQWWEKKKIQERYPGCNAYTREPEMVTLAKEIRVESLQGAIKLCRNKTRGFLTDTEKAMIDSMQLEIDRIKQI
jgi:hypothetical protein